MVPDNRIRKLGNATINSDGEYVLYWMTAFRRTRYNFSLQRAVQWCEDLKKPLLVFEALRCNYRWASDRFHRFVIQGMRDNSKAIASTNAFYFPYVEPETNAASGLLEALMNHSAVVVTDDFPCFFIPTMLEFVSRKAPVRIEAIDSNGLYPMRSTDHEFPTAYAFRRHLQRELPQHLHEFPQADPLESLKQKRLRELPSAVRKHWPAVSAALLQLNPSELEKLPIDHHVTPAPFDGGMDAAQSVLDRFIEERLDQYATDRNEISKEGSSGLSPYLHFGHIAVHEVFERVAAREKWSVKKVMGKGASGKREGWWQMSHDAEGFMDELVTWRELGYNMCARRRDYDRYESLPEWARKSLEKHERDPRPELYTLDELERSKTHDGLWNAAQRQLVQEGRMHNYLRMLWGKKVLQWSRTPKEALHTLIHLNNKYAVDGRNPNSYSGIFWCLGRYDRAWGPERPIFGTIRYMSSDNTAKKFDVKPYLRRFSTPSLF